LFFFFSYREVANPAKREGEEARRRRRRRASLLQFGGWSLSERTSFRCGREESALARPPPASSKEEDKKRVEERSERIVVVVVVVVVAAQTRFRCRRRRRLAFRYFCFGKEREKFPQNFWAKKNCTFRVSGHRARTKKFFSLPSKEEAFAAKQKTKKKAKEMPSPGGQQSRRFFLAKTLCGSLVAGACGYCGAFHFFYLLLRSSSSFYYGLSRRFFCARFPHCDD
jgi:hypothetical protein